MVFDGDFALFCGVFVLSVRTAVAFDSEPAVGFDDPFNVSKSHCATVTENCQDACAIQVLVIFLSHIFGNHFYTTFTRYFEHMSYLAVARFPVTHSFPEGLPKTKCCNLHLYFWSVLGSAGVLLALPYACFGVAYAS